MTTIGSSYYPYGGVARDKATGQPGTQASSNDAGGKSPASNSTPTDGGVDSRPSAASVNLLDKLTGGGRNGSPLGITMRTAADLSAEEFASMSQDIQNLLASMYRQEAHPSDEETGVDGAAVDAATTLPHVNYAAMVLDPAYIQLQKTIREREESSPSEVNL